MGQKVGTEILLIDTNGVAYGTAPTVMRICDKKYKYLLCTSQARGRKKSVLICAVSVYRPELCGLYHGFQIYFEVLKPRTRTRTHTLTHSHVSGLICSRPLADTTVKCKSALIV